ncbi:MAG TPA: DNA primase [Flavobacterium sp.]|uniref:DNA primase n=1 Tax=unclassified Flavobacterium TaxID=196869 RepID=UPI000E995CBA|nr:MULTISPECIES: DNA primase [unclassified Flavobacterium]HBI01463.1 DNA primase [Flavobacterium sp.]HRE76644.1 DNA primase [Flavobacterium sp.]
MRRIIVDYAKLTNDILSMLVEKFPDGYEDTDIIRFRNAQNELIEAVEVRTEDTIYLVKVSKKLATRIENFEEDEDLDVEVETIAPVKGLDLDDDIDEVDVDEEDDDAPSDDDVEIDPLRDSGGSDDDDDDDDFEDEPSDDEDDEEEY